MYKLLATLLTVVPLAALALQPLDNDKLSQVVGQEGIQMSMASYINANMNGSPITVGTNYTNCGSTTVFSSTNCRLAIQSLDGQGATASDNNQWWLVAKNFYAVMNFPAINITSTRTPSSSSPYADASRYLGPSGQVLLASPNNMPVMQLTYPDPIYYLANQNLAIEYGPTGYLQNNYQPALGLRIANVSGGPAELNAEGEVLIYGF